MGTEPPGVLSIPTRHDAMASHRQSGGQIAAVFPIHYARALLRACGVLPVEVWGPPGRDSSDSDAHLQVYTCSIVRAGLSFVLRGGLDATDLILVPHGCDSLQGLGSVLLDFFDIDKPVLTQYLPRGEGPDAVAYLADELGTLREQLAALTGTRPSDRQLMEAIEREEQADRLLAELHAERRWLDWSDRELYRAMRSREYLPAESFVTVARAVLERRRARPRSGIGVLLSGVTPEPAELFDVIDEAGAMVVADDLLCTGRRLYRPGNSPLPLRRMAQSLLDAPPDTTRGSSVDERIDHLLSLARRAGVQAAVFYIVKFCEPEQFYLPLVQKALERVGVRTVTIEIDVSEPLSGQAVTRIEALLESVA